MKIAHLYWQFNGNWGDVVVGDVTRKLFNEFLGEQNYTLFNISADLDYDEINKNDLLLIGGGGIFLWLGYFIQRTDELKKIKIPIIIYSIGLNSFRVENDIHNTIQYRNDWLELLKEKCLFISARNDGTVNEIKDFNKVEFNESPEPCIWTNRYYNSERLIDDKYILFSLANDLSKNRFNVNGTSFDKFNYKIREVVYKLRKIGYKIQAIEHRIPDKLFDINSEKIWNIDEELLKEPSSGLSFYQHAETIITMRGHGQIIPFAYKTPIITIANQRKSIGFANSVEINDYCIDVGEKELVEMIIWAIEDIEINKEKIKDRMQKRKEDLWQKTCYDFNLIKQKI